ncbi:biotin/lipoate--protein ligase family protein [uncultured Paracoccus sp.]|uniref:biotin/lipoate--protein ligase family protein n=1 Tax=uncultured Paracoccus sp. TaxID=189685 RepID=UPI00262E475C|nr:biotin/lipoate--protein ligase family protein [uncultured Paracoccus sp.]
MTPDLPPLLSGLLCVDDPFDVARQAAQDGVDGGLLPWRPLPDAVQGAIVLAPDIPLSRAMAVLPAVMVGMQNALGSIGPSEVTILLGWDGSFWVNGARCGGFRVAASGRDPSMAPNWLVIGWSLPLMMPEGQEAGATPGVTALYDEGVTLAPMDIVSAWGRHSMFWLGDLDSQQGRGALAREWQGLCKGLGEDGFIGVDEDFGRLDRRGDQTVLTPLTTLLED